MISYRIEGNYPVHNSTVTLGFSNEEPIIKVADIIANLGYKYSDEKTIYPIQSGEELVWVCERDETCTSRVIVELSAPYQAKYQKIDIAMPRGFEDKFEWKNPDEDPIIARTYVGDTNFKIQFSQVVEAHEIIDWVKIAGRDCILSPSGTQFIWKDTDPEHETPLEDITAGYVPECDELTIFVPADSRVDTVQWVAAEPIPIEQMYHKKEHMPFFPKTAFGAVFDHNGNSLSRVMSDMTDRMRLAEEDIDDLEAAIGGKVDFDDFVKRVKVNTLPVSLESEDETKYIYHLIEKSGTHEPGYYIFAGNNEVGNPIFNRIDNTLDDVENAQDNKFYARKLNTLTGKLEWKPVTGSGSAGVQDVTVDGDSVVDEDGVAVIDTTEFGKVKDVRVKDDSAEGSHTIVEDGIALLDTDEFGKVKKVQLNGTAVEPGADGIVDLGTVVGVASQNLTDAQKTQARKNIGAELLDHITYTDDEGDREISVEDGTPFHAQTIDTNEVNISEEGSGLTNNGPSILKGAVKVGNPDTDEPGQITVLSSTMDPGKIIIHSGDPADPEARGEIVVTDVDDGGGELRDVKVVKELLEAEKNAGLVTSITENAAKSDGTATGTAPKDLAEAINNVAKNAGSINKITDEEGNEFAPDADKVVAITTATTADLGLIKTDEDKITATSTAKTNDALAMTGKAIEDSLAWKVVDGKDGAVQTYKGATASANYAVAAGNGATASGIDSIALGNASKATAEGAVALGTGGEATGRFAIGLGGQSSAYQTLAIGPASSASKDNATAIGAVAMAEEKSAIAIGTGAMAMDENAMAIGKGAMTMDAADSIAIGTGANTGDANAIAVGNSSNASAKDAIAIGHTVQASGKGAIAIGTKESQYAPATTASGDYAIAIGYTAKATGRNSVAIGCNTAAGPQSFAEGDTCQTTTNASAAHAEGYHTVANAANAHVEGNQTEVHAAGGHAEGYYSRVNTGSLYAHVEGSNNAANNAPNSHVEGLYNITTNPNEHAEGVYNNSHTSTVAAEATRHSIGIGSATERKNAFEVMQNGDAYLIGVGNYEGKDIASATNNVKTLATVINSKAGIQVLTQEEYDAIASADIEPLTIYFIKKQDSAGKDYISTFYVGTIPFGASTGFMLGTNKLDSDKL